MSDAKMMQLKPAPGSSLAQVASRLGSGRTCQVAIVGFDVWVHHTQSHEELRMAIGAEWRDLSGEGNFSVIDFVQERTPYVAVRWKSGTDVSLSRLANTLIRDRFPCERIAT